MELVKTVTRWRKQGRPTTYEKKHINKGCLHELQGVGYTKSEFNLEPHKASGYFSDTQGLLGSSFDDQDIKTYLPSSHAH